MNVQEAVRETSVEVHHCRGTQWLLCQEATRGGNQGEIPPQWARHDVFVVYFGGPGRLLKQWRVETIRHLFVPIAPRLTQMSDMTLATVGGANH